MQSRAEFRELQRASILDAARSIFSERPFDAVTMAEVAERAGVARATVFNHFSSKRGLIDAITTGVMQYYESMLAAALADTVTPTGDLLRGLFVEMGNGIAPDRAFFRSVFRELARHELGLDEGSAGDAAATRARASLELLFERGIARGDIGDEFRASALASAFTHLVNGTINEWLWTDQPADLNALMEESAAILLGAVQRKARKR
jgi:AcrR family transcriptional regulator